MKVWFNLSDDCGAQLAAQSSLGREKEAQDECLISETAP